MLSSICVVRSAITLFCAIYTTLLGSYDQFMSALHSHNWQMYDISQNYRQLGTQMEFADVD